MKAYDEPALCWVSGWWNISLTFHYCCFSSALRNEDKHMRGILQWENEHNWLIRYKNFQPKIILKFQVRSSKWCYFKMVSDADDQTTWKSRVWRISLFLLDTVVDYVSNQGGWVRYETINGKTIVMTITAQALCSMLYLISFLLQFYKIDNIILKFCSLITQLS